MKFDKNFLIFVFSFNLIFFTFGGAQQYLTTIFEGFGKEKSAFFSLFLVYFFSFIISPFSAKFVLKFSPKKSMIISSFFYLIFVIAVISNNEIFMYLFSIILGISSAILWTACGTYIIRASSKENYGKASGFFNMIFSLMIALGMISLGILLQNFPFEISYALVLIPGIFGVIGLTKIKNIKNNEKEIFDFNELFKFFPFFFLGTLIGFLFSLTIGYIPIDVAKNFGEFYVGIVGALFYVIPIFFSYLIGTISDKIGRIKSFIILLFFIFIGMFLITEKFLLYGILIFAFAYPLTKVLLTPLVGDICNGKNLEKMNAFINTSLNFGVFIGLLLSLFVRNEIYIIAMIFILILILLIRNQKIK